MSDDWNIKKEYLEFEFNLKLLGKSDKDEIVKINMVHPDSLETLRQKLIEDINTLEPTYSHSLSFENGIEGYLSGFDDVKNWTIQIINKRFGVE